MSESDSPLTIKTSRLSLAGLPDMSASRRQMMLPAFFHRLAQDVDVALFLEGNLLEGHLEENEKALSVPEIAAPHQRNRWSLMGLHCRQELRLDAGGLHLNGVTVPVSDSEHLWTLLRRQSETLQTYFEDEAESYTGPYKGGWMGYFGYEFSRWCEPALEQSFKSHESGAFLPECLLYEFEDVLVFDWLSRSAWLISSRADRMTSVYQRLWEQLQQETFPQMVAPLSHSRDELPLEGLSAYLESFTSSFSPVAYEQAVERIKRHIAEGDLYQANLSLQFRKTLAVHPESLYSTLSYRNPSPFSAFFKWPGGAILCNSPERLVRVDACGMVTTRPIAGTRGRGRDIGEEAVIAQTLLSNLKEQAEHLMLVDLERNDLGKICKIGSVQVNELMTLERYSHVTHLVSNVTGILQDDRDIWDILRAVFPGGTITGCPKIRCMTLLAEIEPVARGPYTGGLGYIDPRSGTMDINILIRSLYLKATGHEASGRPLVYNTAVHAGAGIVADSVGAYEYRECLRKATAILGALYTHEQH